MELLESVRVARTESAQLALGANVNQQGVLVAVVICLATMSITSVLAAPRQIEDFCFERLEYATLALRRGAGEAFMANCIADLTSTPSPGRKGPLIVSNGVHSNPAFGVGRFCRRKIENRLKKAWKSASC